MREQDTVVRVLELQEPDTLDFSGGSKLLKVEKATVHTIVYVYSTLGSCLRRQHFGVVVYIQVEKDMTECEGLLDATRYVKEITRASVPS